jgi:hypothetical protein
VTETIDGTHAAVIVETLEHEGDYTDDVVAVVQTPDDVWYGVYAQSRKRLLKPGKSTDNFEFAGWVEENALDLAAGLGEGYHFGEWYGTGIQRAYGLDHKRFALFNVGRWHDQQANGCGPDVVPECCSVVPVLAVGAFVPETWNEALADLNQDGSAAAPGFDNPEGIVVFHSAARQSFKVTLEGDESRKGVYKGMHAKQGETATA